MNSHTASPWSFAVRSSCLLISFLLTSVSIWAQQDVNRDAIQRIDASVLRRDEGIIGYTVNEHYAVFRGKDEINPVAEMRVKTTYKRDAGKRYDIQSETGSELPRKVLEIVLDNEKRLSEPANRKTAVITSTNYEMAVKGSESIDGRDCLAVTLKPRRSSPYLFNGTIWVDAQDGFIVQLEGVAAKSASVLSGPSQVFRQYAVVDGFPMATHAKAVSNSWMLGHTVIKIDYSEYQIQFASESSSAH
ncbi:MAG TPA: hypothetical protein VGG85_19805 [Terracidiphilus sp.]